MKNLAQDRQRFGRLIAGSVDPVVLGLGTGDGQILGKLSKLPPEKRQ
jgi:hypothetical protein